MKKNIRIIPRLDIKGPNLVKGIHLEGLRVLGKPEEFASQYYAGGADELIYIDVVASLYGRNSLLDIVERTAKSIFIPLTVGGGIRTIEDIKLMLRAGADKVAINTAAIKNPGLIAEAARTFGSQCIVISIEAKCVQDGSYEAYADNGRERTGKDVFNWAKEAVGLGAGEILLTSIDGEGTGKGFDLELVGSVSRSVRVPVIACGGAGTMDDFLTVIVDGSSDAVSAASVFHYHILKYNPEVNKFNMKGNLDHLKNYLSADDRKFGNIDTFTISDLKDYLIERDVYCRPAAGQAMVII